jgi:hydroxyethylthiazole kinase-like uncharacterized protein yjeF
MREIEPILPVQRTWSLHGVEATRAIEQAALAGLAPHALMQRAGAAVARLAMAVAPHARRVWVAAGPGNNGGDGLDAAIRLRAAGRDVRVSLVIDAPRRPADAQDALDRARAAGVPIGTAGEDWFATLGPDDLAIDALLGIGASRPIEGPVEAAVRRFNALPCTRLAIDLPSGLDADTGAAALCVHAHHTISLITLKPGLFTAQGRDAAGRVWLAPLEVDATSQAPTARLIGSDAISVATRRHASHKGSYGDLAVVGGAAGMTGAALLAARAALRAGAGRVFVALLDGGSMAVDTAHPELMFRPRWLDAGDTSLTACTVVAGCGGGEAIRTALPRLLTRAPRLVLDADALNAIANDTSLQALLEARARRGAATVLTPHPLEAARLLGTDSASVQRDRLGAARALASRWQCIVVLKGSGSVLATAEGELSINGTGSAALASAGTGDVLAGWIGGAWAEAGDGADPSRIAAASVALHGLAAEAVAAGPIAASALIEAIACWRRDLSAT